MSPDHATPRCVHPHVQTDQKPEGNGGVLPSIVAEQQPSRGNEKTDHNGRRRRARDIVGFLPAHGNGHGVGVEVVNPGLRSLESERLRVGEILVEVEGVEINGGTLGDSVWVNIGWAGDGHWTLSFGLGDEGLALGTMYLTGQSRCP
ncbi:hypothetical protein FGRMN_973 [Fusarium graminum]|nr:hypothetical protein FGRMN_973 [Fusarium graminum]